MTGSALKVRGLKNSLYTLNAQLPDGRLRVLSTLWKSIVDLDRRHIDILFGDVKDLTPEEEANIQELCNLGLVLREDEDEEKLALTTLEQWRTTPILNLVLCTTLSCNFSCIYCVQKGNFEKSHPMSCETLEAIIQWCARFLEKENIKNLEIVFFGGEPVLNYEVIVQAMVGFNRLKKQSMIDSLSYQLVTNGSLLSPGKIKVLKALGLREIQVTIDGLPYTHNRRRVGGQGSWGKIWESILYAVEENIKIALNCVVDSENCHELKDLIDAAECFSVSSQKLKQNIWILFSLLIPTTYTLQRCETVLFGKEKEILSTIIDAYAYAKQLGWRITTWLLYHHSAREDKYSYIIAPEGDIYKCYGAIGNKRYCIGNIADDLEAVKKKALEFSNMQPWDEACLKCNIFPICRGGCQHISSLFHKGEYGHKLCEKGLWESALKKALALGVLNP